MSVWAQTVGSWVLCHMKWWVKRKWMRLMTRENRKQKQTEQVPNQPTSSSGTWGTLEWPLFFWNVSFCSMNYPNIFSNTFFLVIILPKLVQMEIPTQTSPVPRLVTIMHIWMSPDWSPPKSSTHWRKVSEKIRGRRHWKKGGKGESKALWDRLWS